MVKRLSSRYRRATLSAARPVHRASIRALRHHVARTRVLSSQPTAATNASGGRLRTWLRAVISALRSGTRARRLLLRRLLRRATIRRARLATAQRSAAVGGRRPRRLSASAGWFSLGSPFGAPSGSPSGSR
jgi:hypothetical protein